MAVSVGGSGFDAVGLVWARANRVVRDACEVFAASVEARCPGGCVRRYYFRDKPDVYALEVYLEFHVFDRWDDGEVAVLAVTVDKSDEQYVARVDLVTRDGDTLSQGPERVFPIGMGVDELSRWVEGVARESIGFLNSCEDRIVHMLLAG